MPEPNLCPDGATALAGTHIDVVLEQFPRVVNGDVLVWLYAGLQTLQASEHNHGMSGDVGMSWKKWEMGTFSQHKWGLWG